MNVEIGDFSVFPLKYLEGRGPEAEGEISLSFSIAGKDALNKKVGDEVTLKAGADEKTLKVTGIYQDVTNGGKTAKAHSSLGVNGAAVLWYVMYIDVTQDVELREKMDEYQNSFESAQVNDIQEYMQQTLGNIIEQMRTVVIGGIIIALIISVLITSLFLRMLLSKDMSQIAILRSIGLTSKKISQQYMAGTLMVLVLGILFEFWLRTF